MSNLARVENNVITSIIVGDAQNFPALIVADGQPWGTGWTTSDGGQTFNPPAFVQQYRTVMTSQEFLTDLLTDDEFDDLEDHVEVNGLRNPVLKKVMARFHNPKRNGDVNIESAKAIEFVAAMKVEGMIDATRETEILLGLPI